MPERRNVQRIRPAALPSDEEPEPPEPSPEYLALSDFDRKAMDAMVESTQAMQNHVDQALGVMGEPVFYMAGTMIQHELQIRTLRRENEELLQRLTALEGRVS